MRNVIIEIFARSLSCRALWRLGRSLYLRARGDSLNRMRTNGEKLLIEQLVGAWERMPGKITVFDVGANVGEWTSLLLGELQQRGMADRVEIHSFEPIPTTFHALTKNIGRFPGRGQVHLVPEALSSEPGKVSMFVVGDTAGTNSLYPDTATGNSSTIQVEATTADLYAQANDVNLIHMVKCDAEGHDMEVMFGARQLFTQQRVAVWQFEYNHRWISARYYLRDVFEFAEEFAYEVGKLTPRGIEFYEAWHPELERFIEGNYVLIAKDSLAWLQVRRDRFDAYGTWVAHP